MSRAGARPAGRTATVAGRVALRLIPALFIAVLFAWPVLALVRRAVNLAAASGERLGELLTRTDALALLGVTLGQAAASTVLALVAAAPIAWLYAHVGGRASVLLAVVVTVPFVLPTVVVGVAFRSLLTGPLSFLHIQSGLGAVLAAHVFINVAVVVRVVGAAWRNLDPRLLEAARTLGAGRLRATLTVVIPRLLPAIAGAAALIFLFCSTSFGVVIILGAGELRTLETEIYTQAIGYFRIPEAVVLSMVQIVVVFAALMLTRVFADPAGTGSARGGVERRRRDAAFVHGRFVRPAMWLVSVWTVVLLVGPVVVLIARSVRPTVGGEWTLAGYRALAEPVNGVTPLESLEYSLVSAAFATVIALVVGVLAAVALHRSRGVVGAIASAISLVPLGISAVTLGFGYLIVLASMPYAIAASPAIIPCVQALIAIPMVIRIMLPALESVPVRLRQAAATLGARPARVFATVDLPIVGRSMGAAAGFAFVMALGEFGASSFLARADTTTLPVLIGSALNRPGAANLATAMAASVVLVAATTLAMLVVEAFRPRSEVPLL
ncbi:MULTISPECIES: ABC transporter permease [Gordonia]|uniref:Iron ABC transporter permease n=2 Tax=Gordonia alkanivorans TaxID=84096 RepID=W9DG64_9ACTN|nr:MULTISPECIES: iron ABC transporter permease [Gordonia]ETA07349.1 iron ABC transporter permease [Gordonia alkanivorans CGMCC 6845]MDH3007750.1 iron ABC transporter permease [Gordonia alkanivorans]MDH3015447.1 iron ABC transporter permease [Gordonia alkanivorans]MDH3020182.1 iron ABC transporter permease [Gordonia alkanivorans]MDH3040404.1 iron ABC transporter permease [Gordonia alkanivorans]